MTIFGKSSKRPQLHLAVLYLAAGQGSRLGGFPKALLRRNGVTLLQSFCSSMQALAPIEIVIVTGYHAQAIEDELASIDTSQLPITMIRNPYPESGQASSVRLGLEALQSHYDVLLITLCDQPNVGVTEITLLLEQFASRETAHEIVLPMIKGQRGNPVMFSKQVIDQILKIPGMVCRPYMDQHPELVEVMNTEQQAFIMDVDTEQGIQAAGLTK
jgi:CTP:molybdopterin cytidylyltransferase MocA